MKILKKGNLFYIFLVTYFFYLLLLIFRSSFIFHGTRYFVLFDDEMVSMRYANNLAHGLGLVWNPGGIRVEGFTNPLWTLYMTLYHFLPIPLSKISFFIQLTGALLLSINLYFVRKLVQLLTDNNKFAVISTVLFTAFYFPLNNWGAILGTEVSALTLLITASTVLTIQSVKKGQFSYLIYILLGIGTFIRMDAIVPAIVIIGYLLVVDSKRRKKQIYFGIPIFLLFILIQFLLRHCYYNEWLPNTYYLKLTGYPVFRRILSGTFVFTLFMNWFLIAIPFALLLIKRNKYIFLILALFIAQVAYSIYVGGDGWEFYGGSNRYITPVMPLYFVFYFLFASSIISSIKERIRKDKLLIYRLGLILFFSVTFLSISYINHFTFLEMLFIKKPIDSADNEFHVMQAYELTKITNKNAKIAVSWAGVIPFFTERYFIDLLGKNDKIIAREYSKRACLHWKTFNDYVACFYPGHMKWDYSYTLGELRPDVVIDAYPSDQANPYLDKYYNHIDSIEVLKNTKNVNLKFLHNL